MDVYATARQAASLLERGRFVEAAGLYRSVVGSAHTADLAYDDWLSGLATALVSLGKRRAAAYVLLYLHRFDQAMGLLGEAPGVDRARVLEQQGEYLEAARLYEEAGALVHAAIAFERGGDAQRETGRSAPCAACGTVSPPYAMHCNGCGERLRAATDGGAGPYADARRCWRRLLGDTRLSAAPYEAALVCFNLGTCELRLGDEGGRRTLVEAQRLLEEAADLFETQGRRERAFDCYQILLELGRRSGAFENLAEGYLNCIRILKEDHLKYYVLQYYEDFLREASRREEFQAAASLYHEAADYCVRTGLIYDRYYLRAAAETWMAAAEKCVRDQRGAEMAENAYLAAVECFNGLGDYVGVGEAYARLAALPLSHRKAERYRVIAGRYRGAPRAVEAPPAFPEYLRQAHAYPDIWYMDLVEWEDDGAPEAICAPVVGDTRYPEIVRRRALTLLLDLLDGRGDDPAGLAAIAEGLGDLQIYPVLSPLERLFEQSGTLVQRGVMRATRYLFFKRTFVVLGRGLASSDAEVRRAALEGLERLHFNHAFDPLVRIFRESRDPEVRSAALESIGRIPSLEAGDFLVEVLRQEPDPLRSGAMRLLSGFENRDLFPVLRQYYELESGRVRADLEQVLRLAGALT
ncbi:MAG: HEAT repeat domain-containing protein [Deltaproteobacteria bacterium]|nr:HEAT repeat domain-containing protein [Deltaproteobacteria bacterium]